MELLEIYADDAGETHFRKTSIDFRLRDFAPPSAPLAVSDETAMTTGLFLVAPPGWDEDFHPTPRRQMAVLLDGRATIEVSDGETVTIGPGDLVLLNDESSKGHLTRVLEGSDARFLLVGMAEN